MNEAQLCLFAVLSYDSSCKEREPLAGLSPSAEQSASPAQMSPPWLLSSLFHWSLWPTPGTCAWQDQVIQSLLCSAVVHHQSRWRDRGIELGLFPQWVACFLDKKHVKHDPSVFLKFIDFCNSVISIYSSAQVVKCSTDYFLSLATTRCCRVEEHCTSFPPVTLHSTPAKWAGKPSYLPLYGNRSEVLSPELHIKSLTESWALGFYFKVGRVASLVQWALFLISSPEPSLILSPHSSYHSISSSFVLALPNLVLSPRSRS